LLLLLIPFLVISFFAYPSADDFCFAVKTAGTTFSAAYENEYLHWTGRYTSNVLVLNNPVVLDIPILYQLFPIATILSLWWSIHAFIAALVKQVFSRSIKLLVSCAFLLLYLSSMPTIAEGIYWFNGSAIYQWGTITALFVFTLWIKAHRKEWIGNQVLHHALTLLLIALTIGFNEVIMLLLLTAVLLYVYFGFLRATEDKYTRLVYALGTCLAASIVLSAPGNEVRAGFYSENQQFLPSLWGTILHTGRFIGMWLFNPPVFITSILVLILAPRFKNKIPLLKNGLHLPAFILPGLLLVILFLSVFPPFWGTGILGQHRTVNVGCFFFLLLWFINLAIWSTNPNLERLKAVPLKPVFIALFLFSFVISFNGSYVLNDLFTGSAQGYYQENIDREKTLKNAKGGTVELSQLNNKPHTIFVLDITTDKDKLWINQCLASHYEVDSIAVKKE
jgi:hypothetical protein